MDYTLIEQIGEGAFGEVWRAVQKSTQRTVAVKILPESYAGSSTTKRRFEREVEIAAQLEHPHIARVYDSGVHEGGYFYAMQLIDGEHLDDFHQAKEHSIEDTLRLFLPICEAVNHAHLNGIIHRDLKPSNILVARDGSPMVLDFGLAKHILPEGQESDLTLHGDISGTPRFMSPEQARGESLSLDTRTDVYSLGAILYLLLTGVLPHPVLKNVLKMLRSVGESDPLRPSTHNPELRGDLEAILLKALARDRDDRYSTAGELAADLRRFLDRRPVAAQGITPLYVTRMWLRKHRAPMAVAGAILIAVSALAIYSVQRIRHERDLARDSFGIARSAVRDLFARLGDRALDDQPALSPLRLLLLEQARDYYRGLLQREPDSPDLLEEAGRNMNVLAQVQFDQGQTEQAWGTLDEAMKLHRRLLAIDPARHWAAFMLAQGHDRLAKDALDRGDLVTGQQQVEAALDLKEPLRRQDPSNSQYTRSLSYSYQLAASLDRARGNDDAAADWQAKVLKLREHLAGVYPDDPETLRMLAHSLGEEAEFLREHKADYAGADKLSRRALAIKEGLLKEKAGSPDAQLTLAYGYSDLARQHFVRREYADGIAWEQQALALKSRLLDQYPDDPKFLRSTIYSHHEMARYLEQAGKPELELDHLDQAQAMLERWLAQADQDPHARQGLAFNAIRRGQFLTRRGSYPDALRQFERARSLLHELFGPLPDDFSQRTLLIHCSAFELDALQRQGAPYAQSIPRIAALKALLDGPSPLSPSARYFLARMLVAESTNPELTPEARGQKLVQSASELARVAATSFRPPDDDYEHAAFQPVMPYLAPDVAQTLFDVAAATPTGEAPAQPTMRLAAVETDLLQDHLGEFVEVHGAVTSCEWNRNRTHLFINFVTASDGFYALILKEDLEPFAPLLGDSPETTLTARTVTLQGTLQEHRGRPQIQLLWPHQMTLGELDQAALARQPRFENPHLSLIDWRAARDHVGEPVRIEGTVVSCRNVGRICYLDFLPTEEQKTLFNLPVFSSAWAGLPEVPEVHFLNKEIEVVGTVTLYREVPQIAVRKPAQIRLRP